MSKILVNSDHSDVSCSFTPLRPYFELSVSKILQKGLEALDKERPSNPLKFLGEYLISHSENEKMV